MSTALQELGISRQDILDRAAEKLLESFEGESQSLSESIRHKVIGDIVRQAQPKIDGILSSALSDIVDAPYTPVDEWGQPMRKKSTTLREMVKERALKFLSEQVNSEGNACTYQSVGSRGEWMAKKAASEAMTYEIKKELSKAVELAKGELRRQVASHIADTLLKK